MPRANKAERMGTPSKRVRKQKAKAKRRRNNRMLVHAQWLREQRLWREAQQRLAELRDGRTIARLWYLRGEGAAF